MGRGVVTYQKYPVRVFPRDRAPARVRVVVLHTSSAAGVISTAQTEAERCDVVSLSDVARRNTKAFVPALIVRTFITTHVKCQCLHIVINRLEEKLLCSECCEILKVSLESNPLIAGVTDQASGKSSGSAHATEKSAVYASRRGKLLLKSQLHFKFIAAGRLARFGPQQRRS